MSIENGMTATPVEPIVSLRSVLVALLEIGVISATNVQDRIKPGHGSCCTCQTCGRHYDDCVCTSNEIVEALNKLVSAN